MKKSIQYLVLFFLLIPIGYSCSENTTDTEQQAKTSDELLMISKSQYQEESMQLGEIKMIAFEEVIKANGRLVAAPNGVAEVNTHISGMISSTSLSVGDYVKKGQTICSIEGNEVIKIQLEYQQASAQLKTLKANYERLKILSKENISSQKELLTVESNYKAASASYNGLKAQLMLLNISPNNVESGTINSSIKIKAPISGYVSIQNCTLGQFVDSQKMLMKIVNIDQLQLEFYVFEKDLLSLKKGQEVRFYSPDASQQKFTASISHIGKSIDPESKTIKCLAQLENRKAANFADRMFMMTEVITNKFETPAVQDEALLKSDDNFYLLSKEKEDENAFYFGKTKVKTGISQNGFTAIEVKKIPKQILIRGGYNLVLE